VLPRSGFIQTVHHGKRTKEEGEEFVKTIKQNNDGEAAIPAEPPSPVITVSAALAFRKHRCENTP